MTCRLVPISAAYELVARLRRNWHGFTGGEESERALEAFWQHRPYRWSLVNFDVGSALADAVLMEGYALARVTGSSALPCGARLYFGRNTTRETSSAEMYQVASWEPSLQAYLDFGESPSIRFETSSTGAIEPPPR